MIGKVRLRCARVKRACNGPQQVMTFPIETTKDHKMRIIVLTVLWLLLVAAGVLFAGCAFLLMTFRPTRAGGAASWANVIVLYYWWGIAAATVVGVASGVGLRLLRRKDPAQSKE